MRALSPLAALLILAFIDLLPPSGGIALAQQPLAREELRVDGKSFDEWRKFGLRELGLRGRLQALEAMRRFGVHGYGKEAAETVMKMTREHCREFSREILKKEKDLKALDGTSAEQVCIAAATALIDIGPPSIPLLIEGLVDADEMLRAISQDSLSQIELRTKDLRVLLDLSMKESGSVEVLELLAHLPSEKFQVLVKELSGKEKQRCVNMLRKALKDGTSRPPAASLLGELGKSASSAVGALLEALDKEKTDKGPIIAALGRIGSDPDRVVPLLTRLVESEGNEAAALALGDFGPAAKSAVPVLLSFARYQMHFKDGGKTRWAPSEVVGSSCILSLEKIGVEPRKLVAALMCNLESDMYLGILQNSSLDCLMRLGPATAEAVPALARFHRNHTGSDERLKVETILRQTPAGVEALRKLEKEASQDGPILRPN